MMQSSQYENKDNLGGSTKLYFLVSTGSRNPFITVLHVVVVLKETSLIEGQGFKGVIIVKIKYIQSLQSIELDFCIY